MTGPEPEGIRDTTPARPPQRVTIIGPRTPYTTRHRSGVEREIDEQTVLGEVYMRSLVRSQLRLAGVVIGVLASTLGLLPLLFYVLPATGRTHIVGLPLPWVLLGFLVYPALIGVAVFYVRQAERNEREFSDLVDRR